MTGTWATHDSNPITDLEFLCELVREADDRRAQARRAFANSKTVGEAIGHAIVAHGVALVLGRAETLEDMKAPPAIAAQLLAMQARGELEIGESDFAPPGELFVFAGLDLPVLRARV
jgi:hypothetical protein